MQPQVSLALAPTATPFQGQITTPLLDRVARLDRTMASHMLRVAAYAYEIGCLVGLSTHVLSSLVLGAALHDIGKLDVDAAILNKPGPLSLAERMQMQEHPALGARLLTIMPGAHAAADIILHHHEHWNGAGYPDALAGSSISLGARIVAVADSFDAMTTDRIYSRAMTWHAATQRLRVGAGIEWDPAIVALFAGWLDEAATPPYQSTGLAEREAGA